MIIVVMTLLWVLLTQDPSPLNILMGSLCALVGVMLSKRVISGKGGLPKGLARFFAWVSFSSILLKDLIVSSLYLLWDIITPKHLSNPLLVDVPIRSTNSCAIALLSSAITVTPGTVTVEVHGDEQNGYIFVIHSLYAETAEEVIRDVAAIEDRLGRCLSLQPKPETQKITAAKPSHVAATMESEAV